MNPHLKGFPSYIVLFTAWYLIAWLFAKKRPDIWLLRLIRDAVGAIGVIVFSAFIFFCGMFLCIYPSDINADGTPGFIRFALGVLLVFGGGYLFYRVNLSIANRYWYQGGILKTYLKNEKAKSPDSA